jgi:hypothetical protein
MDRFLVAPFANQVETYVETVPEIDQIKIELPLISVKKEKEIVIRVFDRTMEKEPEKTKQVAES